MVPTSSVDDKVSVSTDFMDLDSDYEDDDTKSVSVIDLTGDDYDNDDDDDEWGVNECEVKNEEMESIAMEGEEVEVAEYASEELVQSSRCTKKDIDRCVGQLLASQYSKQQRDVPILDKDSILQLYNKTLAPSFLGEFIPLKDCSLQSQTPPKQSLVSPCKQRLFGKELRPSIHKLSK